MRNHSVLLLLGLTAVPLGAQPVPAKPEQRFKAIWEPVNVKADITLFDVLFVSEEVGWVAAGSNEIAGGVILHTRDAGATWTAQYGDPQSSDRAVRSLRFVNERTGWATQGTGGSARLLRTTDGQNWEQAGSIAEHYKDYAFTSPTHGLVVEGRTISVTNDSGQSWKRVAACQTQAEVDGLVRQIGCEFSALHFPTPETGYAVAFSSELPRMFIVFKTGDGGASWQVKPVPAGQDTRDARDVFFTSANTGFVRVGYPDSGRLYRTDDGGQTWRGIGGSPGARIKFTDPEVAWSFHYSKMSYTTDGGSRWNSRTFRFPATVWEFSLPSRRRGFVCGEHGMVYRYRIVPETYSAPGMLDAPMMPARTTKQGGGAGND